MYVYVYRICVQVHYKVWDHCPTVMLTRIKKTFLLWNILRSNKAEGISLNITWSPSLALSSSSLIILSSEPLVGTTVSNNKEAQPHLFIWAYKGRSLHTKAANKHQSRVKMQSKQYSILSQHAQWHTQNINNKSDKERFNDKRKHLDCE